MKKWAQCVINVDGFEYELMFDASEIDSIELTFFLEKAPKENVQKFIELYETGELPNIERIKDIFSYSDLEKIKKAVETSTDSVRFQTVYTINIPGLPFIKVLSEILGAYESIFHLLEAASKGEDLQEKYQFLENINQIIFSGYGEEKSRISLYDKFADKIAKRFKTKVEKGTYDDTVVYKIPIK